jgi:transposase InsO family protein
MTDAAAAMPVFHFETDTIGTYRNRKIRFVRRANVGYLVEFMESPEAQNVPEVMRGTRPDIEVNGRRIIPHAELTAALMDGTLDIDETEFVFIDHSQTFDAKFVASLDDRSAQDLILRYATVTLMREICAEKGIRKITRPAVTQIENEIFQKLQLRLDLLNGKVEKLRRHPFRRVKAVENVAKPQRMLEWDDRLRTLGFCSLVDRRYLSGNRETKVHPAVAGIIAEVLKERVTREAAKIKHLHKRIASRVNVERANRETDLLKREQDGETISAAEREDLKLIIPPCKRTVKSWKARLAPLDQIFRSNGPDWLLRNQLISGEGLNVQRAGQVVMIDEYDLDLMTIVPYEFLVHWLGQAKVDEFKITGDKPVRVILSVTLDAFTGCILGLQIGMTATPELAKRTIMMSMMDKTKIAEACGAKGLWNQFLRPEKIMHDSGNAYLAFVTEGLCAQLRIDKISAPKAKAYIRGMLERVFRTVHEMLLSSIPGKTFSNTVLRGEYDSEAEAVLSLDDLVRILTIWVVDIYHNNPNLGRDDQTPADLWAHEMTVGMGCRPVPGLKTLTHVFGTTLMRRAQQNGIRIMHANYFSKEFALHLLRDPTRQFRVRWWEENMSEAQVEIRPNVWIPLEVMDARARGLSVDEWIRVFERAHVKRDPKAATRRQMAEDEIDAIVQDRIALRRKVKRKTFVTEADLMRLEEATLRFFVTPTTRITSDQTSGIYGVPIGALLGADDVAADRKAAESALPVKHGNQIGGEKSITPSRPAQTAPRGRRKATTWKPGTME